MRHCFNCLRITKIAILLFYVSGCFVPAHARLGEDFAAFKVRILHVYESAGQQNNNFFFKLKLTPRQQQLAPGYAVGITTTVINGKIVGESMACIAGNNHQLGSTLAALDAFTFTCEATGKPLPQEQKQAQAEFTAFARIVQQAFSGQPQAYSYPGYPNKISLEVDKTGRLIIACSPQESQAQQVPSGPTLPPPPPTVVQPAAPSKPTKPTGPQSGTKQPPATSTSQTTSKKTIHK
jgi:hypothetical protein